MSRVKRQKIDDKVDQFPLQLLFKLVDAETLFTLRLVNKKFCKIASIPALWNQHLYPWLNAIHMFTKDVEKPKPDKLAPWSQFAQITLRRCSSEDAFKRYFKGNPAAQWYLQLTYEPKNIDARSFEYAKNAIDILQNYID